MEDSPYLASPRIADALDFGVERDEKFGNVAKVTTKALGDDIYVTPSADAFHSNFLEERSFCLPEWANRRTFFSSLRIHGQIWEQQSYHRQSSLIRRCQRGVTLNGEEFAMHQIQSGAETATPCV